METTLTEESQRIAIELFKQGKTVREISDKIGYGSQDILVFLTGKGLWSIYCSGCVLKRCYDCPGLSELGRPLGVQDAIDLKVSIKKSSG